MINQKSKIFKIFLLLIFFTSYELRVTNYELFAQDDAKLTSSSLEEVVGQYFKDNKYNECVEYLKSLGQKKSELMPAINYYIALTRYHQLKHLEESQDWNEYFNRGNEYRSEIQASAQKTIDATSAKDQLNIYAKLVLWRLHKDQADNASDAALSNLMDTVLEYSKDAANIALIKDIANQLQSYGEKLKSKELYKIYVDKLVASSRDNQDLESAANSSYKEANLDLAETIYDAYIERSVKTLPKEKLIQVLENIAKQFSYSEGQKDMVYAEKIFKKIEDIGGKDVFNQDLIYLRAFNLEKTKEHSKAKDVYIDLVNRYPNAPHVDEANYKIGIIYTYILRDIKSGTSYFGKLAQKEIISAEAISSLYQLGLLSQWLGDFVKARQYYNKLVENAKDSFTEKVNLTKERLNELNEAKPIEYNLKAFLDVSLKEENAMFDMTKINFKITPYSVKNNERVNIDSTTYTAYSGCIPLKLEYLWSGDLGSAKPSSLDKASFETSYPDNGTKQINLVVISPTGIIDRSFDMVNVN